MNGTLLYQPKSEHGRRAEEYARDFERLSGHALKLVDWDSIEGSTFAQNRDIVVSPAIVITDDRGSIVRQWLGDQFPLFDELMAYLVRMP